MKYTYNEALKLATEFFGNELSASVFISKYAMQDNDGMYDEATPDQLHDRLAKEFARIDSEKYGLEYKERYDVYFDAMKNFARVVPQGSPMAAVGNKYQTMSASNCVVVESPKDSMGGIMDTAKHLTQLMKRRCVEVNTYVIIKGVGPTEIKNVRVGNEILSFDINTGENVFKKIKDVFVADVSARDRISITYRDGTVLKTSKKHPVLIVSENGFEYRNAYDLKIHDKNITQYHNNVEVTSIEHDQISWEYMDIEVEDTNNFFANSSKQGNYVVIHNCGVGVDISTLRPEGFKVNNAAKTTSGAWSFADLYSYVTRMTAQCIAEGERVLTDNGLKPIEDVQAGVDKVWTKKGWVNVLDVINSGVKKTKTIKTEFGFEISTSEDHIFLSEDDFNINERRLKDFEVGDNIIIIPGTTFNGNYLDLHQSEYISTYQNKSNRLNKDITLPTKLTPDFAYLLGVMYGDGNVNYDKLNEPIGINIACAHEYPKIENKIIRIYKELINYDAKIKLGDGALNCVSIHSKLFGRFLKENGILKEYSENISVPALIIKSPSDVQLAFIAGFFDADGTNGAAKKGYAMCSVSLPFLKDLQTMLMANGIASKIHVEDRKDKGWRDLYSLCITGQYAQSKVVEYIDNGLFQSEKVEKFISKRDTYITPYNAKSFNVKYNKYNYCPSNEQLMSTGCFNKLVKDGAIQDCKALIKDSIISITDNSEVETYDLVLETEHLFWCEGFYVHNSGRRGALMITMSSDHPDVSKFATSKHDITKVTGANISVRLSDKFLTAVANNTEYEQRFPLEGEPIFTNKVKAKEVWDVIVNSATKTADPGLIFWDNMINNLPAHCYEEFKTISTNPCSEIALSAYDSCRLVSLNLTGYVKNAFDKDSNFDIALFQKDIRTAMQMIDNLVDIELELIKKIQASCTEEDEIELWQKLYDAGYKGRRTGLGTHGLADTLAMLNIKYDSDDGIKMIEKIYSFFKEIAYDQSFELAKVRGSFPLYDFEKERKCDFINRLPKELLEKMQAYGRRNISILTQAPTGSVSIVSKCGEFNSYNVSSGVEPVFRNSYTRRKKINNINSDLKADHTDALGDKWQEYKVFHSNVQNYLNKFNLPEDTELPDYFVTSDQVSWNKRVQIQSVEQLHVDHSISSTINLPRGTTSETVGAIYLEAWKQGLKGITVYVEGSKDGVLISDEEKKKQESKKSGRPESIEYASAPKRGNVLPCDIHQATIKGKKWVVLVGMLGNDPYELFCGFSENLSLPSKCNKGKVVKKGKGEYDLHVDVGGEDLIIKNIIKTFDNPEFAWTTRLVSVSLRHGVAIDFLVEQLSKDGGLSDINRVMSRILKKYIKDGQKVKTNTKCEGCKGTNLVYSEGCVKCMDCGFSKCN